MLQPQPKIELSLKYLSEPSHQIWLDSRIAGAYVTNKLGLLTDCAPLSELGDYASSWMYNWVFTQAKEIREAGINVTTNHAFYNCLSVGWPHAKKFVHPGGVQSRFDFDPNMGRFTGEPDFSQGLCRRLINKVVDEIVSSDDYNAFDVVFYIQRAVIAQRTVNNRSRAEMSLVVNYLAVQPAGISVQAAAAHACSSPIGLHIEQHGAVVQLHPDTKNQAEGSMIWRYHRTQLVQSLVKEIASMAIKADNVGHQTEAPKIVAYIPFNIRVMHSADFKCCELCMVGVSISQDVLSIHPSNGSYTGPQPVVSPLTTTYTKADILSLLNNTEA